MKRFLILLGLLSFSPPIIAGDGEEEYFFLPSNNLHLQDKIPSSFVDEWSSSEEVWCIPGQKPGQTPGQKPCQPKPTPPDQKPTPTPTPTPTPPAPTPPDQKPKCPTPCQGAECDFNSLIDNIERVYKPVFESNGYKLVINKDWYNPTVNLKTRRVFGTIVVDVYGGIARRREITPDGLSLAVCHEFGRFLGGFAKNKFGQAVAGQADYFTTLSCGRELWRNDTAYNESFKYVAPDYVKRLCEEVYNDQQSQNLCFREMVGSYSIAILMAVLDGRVIYYDIHDLGEVPQTTDCHGTSQCRMDTLMAGAICPINWSTNVISKTEMEAVNQSCTEYVGYVLGYRPRCWFKPTLPSCNGSGC